MSKILGSVFTLCSINIDVKIVDLVAGEPMVMSWAKRKNNNNIRKIWKIGLVLLKDHMK